MGIRENISFLLLCCLTTPYASAAPVYEVTTKFSAANWYPLNNNLTFLGVGGDIEAASDSSNLLATAAIQGSTTLTGLNQIGNPDTASIRYSGAAAASLLGGLKVQASVSGDKFFWNKNNAPYGLPGNYGNVNPNGTPTFYQSRSQADLTDKITVTGDAGLSKIKLVFSINGVLTSVNQNSSSLLYFSVYPLDPRLPTPPTLAHTSA